MVHQGSRSACFKWEWKSSASRWVRQRGAWGELCCLQRMREEYKVPTVCGFWEFREYVFSLISEQDLEEGRRTYIFFSKCWSWAFGGQRQCGGRWCSKQHCEQSKNGWKRVNASLWRSLLNDFTEHVVLFPPVLLGHQDMRLMETWFYGDLLC